MTKPPIAELSNPFPFTPDEAIAGRIRVPRGIPPTDAAYQVAARALDCERICLSIVVESDGEHVGYLAAPAAAFASRGGSAFSPLLAALPGAPGHCGAGVYSVRTPLGRCGALVADDGRISTFAGDRDSIRSAAEIHGVKLVEVDDDEALAPTVPAMAWMPHQALVEARNERRDRAALFGGSGLAIAACLAWVALSFGAGFAGTSSGASPISVAVASPVVDLQSLKAGDGAAATLRHFLEVGDLARQTQGLVRIYRVDGKETRFALELPAWVTRTQIESLGPSKVSASAKGVLVEGRKS